MSKKPLFSFCRLIRINEKLADPLFSACDPQNKNPGDKISAFAIPFSVRQLRADRPFKSDSLAAFSHGRLLRSDFKLSANLIITPLLWRIPFMWLSRGVCAGTHGARWVRVRNLWGRRRP